MKKIFISMLLIIATICFSSCGTKDVVVRSQVLTTEAHRFVSVGDTYQINRVKYDIYYDSKTKIVYLANSEYQQIALSVMYNSDGQPMNIDEYNKTK